MQSTAQLVNRFKSEGLKITPQRLAVFDAIVGNHSHPTAEAIWAKVKTQMPTISLRTIYQVLNDLVELGELTAVEMGGCTRFDPNNSTHDHFVCTQCNLIADTTRHGTLELLDQPGAVIETTEVVFRGICAACLTQSSPSHC